MRTEPAPGSEPTSGQRRVPTGAGGCRTGGERRESRGRASPPARPFVVQVAALRRTAGATRHEVRRGAIDDLAAVGVAVHERAPVVADLILSSYPGGIMAVGTVRASWEGECRRCGGPVAGEAIADLRERFAPLHGADEDAYVLAGDDLDLEPLVRDAVLLELPLAPLCSSGCRGLCPSCGTNWNEDACRCVPAGDPRWSSLDVLRDP